MSDTASKSAKASIISAYLDDEKPDRIAVFLVREVVSPQGYVQAGAVQGSGHGGWRVDPGTWLKYRQEYDDVGEHSLLTDAEAQTYLSDMGLTLEDGKRLLIDRLIEVNGYAPDILPEDPNLIDRRAAARARKGLTDTG